MLSKTCSLFLILFFLLFIPLISLAEDPCEAECKAKFGDKNSMLMGGCLGSCYSQLAVKSSNPDSCDFLKEKFPAYFNQCLGEYVQKKQDPQACTKLTKDIIRWGCIGTAVRKATDLTPCESLTDPDNKDACIFGIATQQKKPEFCSKIQGNVVDIKNRCPKEATPRK